MLIDRGVHNFSQMCQMLGGEIRAQFQFRHRPEIDLQLVAALFSEMKSNVEQILRLRSIFYKKVRTCCQKTPQRYCVSDN